ncbi:MAG TPA: immunoglobulin domain-containing protein [Candidatus Acidoferrum sp.]|nr:immunoglobulin domain-containing protein [Candidatus Acidoferrum sp.]
MKAVTSLPRSLSSCRSLRAVIAVGLGLAVSQNAVAQRQLGTDVSGYQPSINWTTAKNAGVVFAWAKATEGTGYVNPDFTAQESGAKGVGIYIGAYHFARPSSHPNITGSNSADSEASYFWSTAGSYVKNGGGYCVPMLDWEDTGATVAAGFTVTQLSQWVNEWCTSVSNYARANGVYGMKPVVYTGVWYSAPSGTYPGLNSSVTIWPDWIAAYPYCNSSGSICGTPHPLTDSGPSSSYPWSTWQIWQYGNTNWSGGDSDVSAGNLSAFMQTFVIGVGVPSITNQPATQTVLAGSNVTFTVGVSGATPLYYQWHFNGTNLVGATTSTLIRYNAQLANAGSYTVTVTNSYGSTNSATAVLTVHAPPVITAQPTNVVTGVGMPASFSVGVSGSTPFSYKWTFNGAALSGATASTLTVAASPTNSGSYAVVVTNLYGTVTSSNAVLTAMDPFITNQPQSVTVAAGAPAAFGVGAAGTPPLSYSWAKNGVVLTNGGTLSGQGSTVLRISSAQVQDVGTYTVTVSNLNGSVLSSNAVLTAAYAPVVAMQPVGQAVPAGSIVVLNVTLLGPQPIFYQWRLGTNNLADGGEFIGSATASLTISNVQTWDQGAYSVVATNAYGSATSSNALVTLWPLLAWGAGTNNPGTAPNYGQCIVPAGLSNVTAVAGGLFHSLALLGDGTVAAWGAGQTNKGSVPYVGQAIVPANLSNAVSVAAGYYHSLALISDGTVVAWGAGTTNTGVAPQYGQSIVPAGLSNVVDIAAGASHSLAAKSDGTVVAWGSGTTGSGISPDYGQAIVPSGLSNVVAVSAGTYHSLALSADGTVTAWGAGTTNSGVSPQYGQCVVPASVSNAVMIAAGGYFSLALLSDGTVVGWGDNTYGQTTPPAGLSNVVAIAAGRYNGLALKCDGTLVAWGAGLTNAGSAVNAGQSIIPPCLTNAIAVSGGASHSLAVEGSGSPVLTVQPPSRTVPAGTNVLYVAMAAGAQPLSYQWQLDGTNLAGATASALNLAAVQFDDAGQYSVIVTNSLGAATSSNALLTVLSGPVITQQPLDQTVGVAAPFVFTVVAGGTPPFTYQWQFNSGPIDGATGSSYGLSSADPTNAGTYSVVVFNNYGAAPSSNAVLTVVTAPDITMQPSNQTVLAGGSASFSVQATSQAPLDYQWYFNQTNLLAVPDSPLLSLSGVQAAQAGGYSVVVSNIGGSITSSLALLTVLVPSPILVSPSLTEEGGFQVGVAGEPGSNYVIEASTNLSDWTPLETNTSPFTFTDPGAGSLDLPLRFYRARPLP